MHVHAPNRPQAAHYHFGSLQRHPHFGCSQVAQVGKHPISIQLRHHFRRTEEHANVDGLSRSPLNVPPGPELSTEAACFNLGQMRVQPAMSTKLAGCSCQHWHLRKVMLFTRRGWPTTIPPDLKSYSDWCNELTVEGN